MVVSILDSVKNGLVYTSCACVHQPVFYTLWIGAHIYGLERGLVWSILRNGNVALSLRPKKGCGAMSILGVYTHIFSS